ncbi:MAG: DUF4405 domain-containing protein [Sedimentisphaerales bacterium]|nr:DUF4405 domain-containing protein [Sedimentisphaerales bacterium]
MGKEAKNSFDKRRFVSLLTGFSFVLMALTGFALFFAPSCRVARDSSWSVLGHSKDLLAAVHVWFCAVFVIAAGCHIYLNWTAIKNYFKSKVGKGISLRTEWIVALVICLAVYVGTVRSVWPFSSLVAWHDTYKHLEDAGQGGHGRRGGGGGRNSSVDGSGYIEGESGSVEGQAEPGTGNSLKTEGADAALRGRGQGANASLRGMGQMTLGEFCRAEGIELDRAIARLYDEGFAARGDMTMREIAAGAGVHPRELRDILGVPDDDH